MPLREGYLCLEKSQGGQMKLFIAYLIVICKGILVAKFHDPPSNLFRENCPLCSEMSCRYIYGMAVFGFS